MEGEFSVAAEAVSRAAAEEAACREAGATEAGAGASEAGEGEGGTSLIMIMIVTMLIMATTVCNDLPILTTSSILTLNP